MPELITTASTLQCPHGGTVTGTPGANRATADAVVLRATDTFTIAGCPFTLPSGPSPCLTVQWVSTATKVRHAGDFVLNSASVGLCMGAAPQGAVMVASTQAKVSGL